MLVKNKACYKAYLSCTKISKSRNRKKNYLWKKSLGN